MKKKKNPLWDILKKYKFNSVLVQTFAVAIFLMMIPLLMVIGVTKKQMDDIVMWELKAANEQSLERTANALDLMMNQMLSFAYYLSENSNFQYLTILKGEELETEYRELYSEKIRFYQKTTEYVDSVYIYLEEENLVLVNELSGNIGMVPLQDMTDKSWLNIYSLIEDEWFLLGTRAYGDFYPYYVSMIYPISVDNDYVRGCIVVNANIKKISKILGDTNGEERMFFMVDDTGSVLYTNQLSRITEQEFRENISFLMGEGEDFSIVSLENEEYLLSVREGSIGKIRYALCVPMTEYRSQTDKMNSIIIKILLVTVAAGVVASYFLALHSYNPIRHILTEVNQPVFLSEAALEDDQLDETEELIYKNELQYISQMVQKTKVSNNRLQMESKEWMKKLKNAQLLALQSQMDPHYIYNALDVINWDAVEQLGYDNSVSDMITALAQFLRISLQRSSYLITVREEMKHAQCYAQIVEKRFAEEIKLIWDLPENILHYKIIRLCVQPLIENAVNHGLRSKRYQGRIIIGGAITDDYLCISVEDDGVGMEESCCRELNRELMENYAADSEHVGIRNVNQRIKILCGNEYGVVVSPGHYGGLWVRILFPKMK